MRVQRKSIDFKGHNFYVGIDVHKKSWTVTILNEEYEHKTFSCSPSVENISKYLERNFKGGDFNIVYEAGFCGFGVQRGFAKLGMRCIVIHPADVPNSSKQRQQKTDVHDSRSLARYLRGGLLKGIWIPDEQLEEERHLVRQRFTIVKDLSRVKNRVKSLLMSSDIKIPEHITTSQSRHWSKVYTKWLDSVIEEDQGSLGGVLRNHVDQAEELREVKKRVTMQIRKLSQTDRYKEDYELMVSVPGIGLMTGMTILTEIGDIKRFKRLDELCSYVGLIPRMNNSGERTVTGKLVNRGRKEIKIMLIEASWVAIRHDSALMLKFGELSKKMNKNKAIIRIARKLLNRIRHILINKVPYEKGIVQ